MQLYRTCGRGGRGVICKKVVIWGRLLRRLVGMERMGFERLEVYLRSGWGGWVRGGGVCCAGSAEERIDGEKEEGCVE